MRYLLIILTLFISIGGFAENADSISLARTIRVFNKALVNRDTVELNRLLKDDVHYYHSNGWLQLKRDVIEDLYNGKLTYKEVNATMQGIKFTGNIAQARMIADVDVALYDKRIKMKLQVVQVWLRREGRWVLYSRHSEKI